LGDIDKYVTLDFGGDLNAAGVNVAALANRSKACELNKTDPRCGFRCNFETLADEKSCLAGIGGSTIFGSLMNKVHLYGVADASKQYRHDDYSGAVMTGIAGTLEYEWTDSDGTIQTRTSPFREVLPLGKINEGAECGEGSPTERIAAHPLRLRLDEAQYRIAVPFQRTIPATRVARFGFELTADRSSQHDFSVVLQLSDGRVIRSRPVNLLYFLPSYFRLTGS
jgi:hypothetical protein